jgi:ATP-dependent Clp protease ATP-binding subunit ClpX
MPFRRRLACSLCGKSAGQVAKLVAGPRVYICDGCVDIAKRIMDDSDAGPVTHSRTPSLARRIGSRLRELIGPHRATRLLDSRVA